MPNSQRTASNWCNLGIPGIENRRLDPVQPESRLHQNWTSVSPKESNFDEGKTDAGDSKFQPENTDCEQLHGHVFSENVQWDKE